MYVTEGCALAISCRNDECCIWRFFLIPCTKGMLDGDNGKVSADQNANLQLHFVLLAIPPAPAL